MKGKLCDLDNQALKVGFERVVSREIQVTGKLLLALNEIESRELYLEWGYSSMFSLMVNGYGFSEGASHRRISSARLVKRYPRLYDLIVSRQISLTSLSMVAKLITDESLEEVLKNIQGKTKREIEAFQAVFRPKTRAPKEEVKIIAVLKAESKTLEMAELEESNSSMLEAETQTPAIASIAETTSQALSPKELETRYQLKFNVNESVYKQLEEVKSLMSGKFPTGVKLEQVFSELIETYLAKKSPSRRLERRAIKQAKTHKQIQDKVSLGESNSRYIPRAVYDQVFVRDKGCCKYISPDGTSCNSDFDLEVHHLRPYGKGGKACLGNLELRCRKHNLFHAKQDFGKAVVECRF